MARTDAHVICMSRSPCQRPNRLEQSNEIRDRASWRRVL